MAHRLDHRLLHRLSAMTVRQVQQRHVAGGSLDECANRGLVLRPGNEVPLPVPWNRTISGLRGTLGDVDHASDASAPFGCPPGLA